MLLKFSQIFIDFVPYFYNYNNILKIFIIKTKCYKIRF